MTEEEKQIIIKQINKGNSLKEFTCPCCDITFTDLYDFRKHLFKKHKTEWNECFQKVQIPMIKQKKEKRELFLTPEQILERKIKSDLKRQIKKDAKRKHSWGSTTQRLFGSKQLPPHRQVNMGKCGNSDYDGSNSTSPKLIYTPMGNKR